MKQTYWIPGLLGAALGLGLCGPARAQQASQSTRQTQGAPGTTTSAPGPRQRAASSAHKVWTDDDLQALKTPADLYQEQEDQKQEAAEQEQAAAAAAAAKNAAANSPQAQPAPQDTFLHPTSVGEADHNIQHEENDLVSQRQYVEELKKRIATAPPGEKEHLQQVLAQREQVLQKIQSDTQGLEAAKAKLEQQQAAGPAATPDIGMAPQNPPTPPATSGADAGGSSQASGSGADSSGGGSSQQRN